MSPLVRRRCSHKTPFASKSVTIPVAPVIPVIRTFPPLRKSTRVAAALNVPWNTAAAKTDSARSRTYPIKGERRIVSNVIIARARKTIAFLAPVTTLPRVFFGTLHPHEGLKVYHVPGSHVTQIARSEIIRPSRSIRCSRLLGPDGDHTYRRAQGQTTQHFAPPVSRQRKP